MLLINFRQMNKLILIIALFFIVSCDSDQKLEQTVFIPDADDPTLPIYSEMGYNTFGAYVDRESFISTQTDVPFKIAVSEGSTNIYFDGKAGGIEGILRFVIPNFAPSNPFELSVLHQKTFDLLADNIGVGMLWDGKTEDPVQVLEGTIEFTRFQNVIVDKESAEVVLSGRFSLKVQFNGVPVAIREGRFDVGVNDGNFFSI